MIYNNVYLGERYDSRIRFGEQQAGAAHVFPPIDSVLRGALCPADRQIRTLVPRQIWEEGERRIYDLGENTTGKISIVTSAPSGTEITAIFSEVYDSQAHQLRCASTGTDRNNQGQLQKLTYISDGTPFQRYEPVFSIQGFQYVEVTGPIQYCGFRMIYTQLEGEGHLITSSPVINRMVDSYLRSQRTNFHCGVPSDCPHRERQPYTGDGQLTADTACLFWDMEAFYRKWMQDMVDCQCKKSGQVPHTAPFVNAGGRTWRMGQRHHLCPLEAIPPLWRSDSSLRLLRQHGGMAALPFQPVRRRPF